MFKITPVQDINITKAYIDKCNITLKNGAFVYAMTDIDSGALMAVSQFEITKEYGYIYNIKEVPGLNDFEAMFILGRQTMNFIDLCGTHICRASKYIDQKLLIAIGFKPDENGEFICDMTGFFDGSHCSSKH